ncbi:DUF7448 domain-containing protein [Arthrobacter russicus]|uniref:DUF7448 domain-containing protein n=1 Tax=Arthrobacter russicus TaxID=172040 RepID=A0ABU1J8Y2_9MICC|nr:hypothetical protein [Arthrobacter russicus]MDR6268886.1 hypothetical protein [Arthrobacter russicus]
MNRIYDMTEDDLAKIVLGKTITNIDTKNNTCTLNDGTILEFEDTSDCCAWFSAELHAGHLTQNMITNIQVEDKAADDQDFDQKYTIHVLAEATEVLAIDIEGTPTSGYYCHSINLNITSKDQS